MPFTPFHFGPGALLHAAAPRQVSFLAFCAANVLTDLEPLYYLATHQYPVHRFCHTIVGAGVIWLLTCGLWALGLRLASRFSLPNLFHWQDLHYRPIAIGAGLGSFSHIFLDGLMHRDLRPWAPFSESNPWLGMVSYGTLQGVCLGAGILGLIGLGFRKAPAS
jgi:membrane-bound metal-dependent hydrolase YbcI (DUF457 family)